MAADSLMHIWVSDARARRTHSATEAERSRCGRGGQAHVSELSAYVFISSAASILASA
jgi:hypothetical protein